MRARVAGALLLSLTCAPVALASAPPWGEKSLGILLIGEGEGAEWSKLVAESRKAFADRYPVEAVAGVIGARELQRPIDRLQAAKVRKIVVVPVRLYSDAPEIAQLQYLLGMREYPSADFLRGDLKSRSVIRRARAKVPMTMTKALDDDLVLSELVTERAREMSREPLKESLILVGTGGDQEQRRLDSLAKEAAREARLVSGRGIALHPAASLMERDANERSWRRDLTIHPPLGTSSGKGSDEELRQAVSNASRSGRVLVVPYLLTADGTERLIRKKLEGLFFQWKGKGLLYDERVLRWVKKRVSEGTPAPNMVKFKDDGKALPPPAPKKL